jgi:hypothetical protein
LDQLFAAYEAGRLLNGLDWYIQLAVLFQVDWFDVPVVHCLNELLPRLLQLSPTGEMQEKFRSVVKSVSDKWRKGKSEFLRWSAIRAASFTPNSLLKNCLTGMLYWEANPH